MFEVGVLLLEIPHLVVEGVEAVLSCVLGERPFYGMNETLLLVARLADVEEHPPSFHQSGPVHGAEAHPRLGPLQC